MTTETQELKACWCCNAPAILERASDHHGEWFNLGCSRHWEAVPDRALACPAGRIWYTADPSEMEAAITAWNTRPREAALEAEVAALGAQVRSAAEAAQVVWSGEHARLEAALRPFLALARTVTVDGSPDFVHWAREAKDWTVAFSFAGHSISIGDLRALAALRWTEEASQGEGE